MNNQRYPRILEYDSHPKNISQKCLCGDIGRFKSHVQINNFRVDDFTTWRCKLHKTQFHVKFGEFFNRKLTNE